MGGIVGDIVEGAGDALGGIVEAAGNALSGLLENPQGLILMGGIAFATGGLGALAAGEMVSGELAGDLGAQIAAGWESAAAEGMAASSAAAVGDTATASLASGAGATAEGLLGSQAAGPALDTATEEAIASGYEGGLAQGAPGAPAVQAASAPESSGLLNSANQWAQKNPLLAATGVTVAGGALKGIGDRNTALEVADKKATSERALLDKRLQNDMEFRDWMMKHGISHAALPVSPSANKVVQRPSGSPVYQQNGLLTSNP